jgi:hypothetical protein
MVVLVVALVQVIAHQAAADIAVAAVTEMQMVAAVVVRTTLEPAR